MFGDCTDIVSELVDFRENSCGEGVCTVEQDVLEGLFHVLLPHSVLLQIRLWSYCDQSSIGKVGVFVMGSLSATAILSDWLHSYNKLFYSLFEKSFN